MSKINYRVLEDNSALVDKLTCEAELISQPFIKPPARALHAKFTGRFASSRHESCSTTYATKAVSRGKNQTHVNQNIKFRKNESHVGIDADDYCRFGCDWHK